MSDCTSAAECSIKDDGDSTSKALSPRTDACVKCVVSTRFLGLTRQHALRLRIEMIKAYLIS